MQAPASLNLTMYQGASWDYTLTWTTTAGSVTTPVDLTGYTARMQVRETQSSTATVLSLTSGTGITLGGTAGTILLEASATTTAGIATSINPQNQFVYDLELVSGAGYVTRLVEGNFFIDPEVTR
jgi:hypothetical protein